MRARANRLLTACAAMAVALGAPAAVHADDSTPDRNNPQPYAVADPTVFTDPLTVQDMNHGTTAQAMAQSLLGGGVSISNVVYTGAPNAAGLFNGGAGSEAIIGFDSGIVMGSGSVQTVAPHNPPCNKGVEGPNQCAGNTTVNGTPGDPDLNTLSGHLTFDAAVLQFDFVPQFATAQFKYVFSSDEYNEYANSPFNDTFGFFVNNVNCALVPGTNLAVGVNTINGGNPFGTNAQHPQYFRNNDPATRTVAINTEMDGLTTVLTCDASVNAGVSNHIKLAIADASDSILDSNVFIAGGSFVSGTQVSTTLSGGGQSGASITVPPGTAVTDSATLAGTNAAGAGGTVHYQVYSDTTCDVAHKVADGGTKTVSNGQVPNSDPVTFTQAGTFSWQASYSGDSLNNPAINSCGSETVTVAGGEQQITAQGTTFTSTEGAVFSGTVATFSDPDPSSTASEYSASIAWGDNATTAGTVSGPTGGPFTVSGTHTYADEGTYNVAVTITDTDTPTNTATASSTANVADAALTAGQIAVVGGTEGSAATTASFSFSDANAGSTVADFTATINWGDTNSSAGTVTGSPGGPYTVTGSHTYAEEGQYSVTVTVNDDGLSTTSATATATVGDAALSAVCRAPASFTQDFNGTVATFSDAATPSGTLSDFSATIYWGDGSSSAGAVSGSNGGPYTVTGSHHYGSTAIFTITVSITDIGGATATTSCNTIIFAFAPGGGAFVIGDRNSAVGTSVTFWGAQWWKRNSLSGGPAPASFKGFAEHPTTPTCGVGWSTDPGNSTPPPAGPLPTYMAVIVTSSTSMSGSEISGNTVHIVIVRTNPGYAPDPGNPGTGTVVAQVC